MNPRKLQKKDIHQLSENDLRKNIVIPLVDALLENGVASNGPYKVEDWHGSSEAGIDVYFGYTDFFGRTRHYGIQVKRGNLVKVNRPGMPNSVIEIKN